MTNVGPYRAMLAAAIAVGLAGCATLTERTVVREIQGASVTATAPLARVAIVAVERDAAARQAWEGAFAARLGARGVAATTAEGLRAGRAADADVVVVDGAPVIEAARRAGADAILFVQPPTTVPIEVGRGAYRWFDARSAPDPRTDLDTTPASVTEVRLFSLHTNSGVWRAMVLRYYPAAGAGNADEIASFVAAALAKRGYLK
jgi:hypothetical protein